MFLTTRAIALALVISVAPLIVFPSPWLVALAGNALLALLIARDVVSAPRASSLELRRDHPLVTSLGDEAQIVLHLHNPSRRALVVHVRDATAGSMGREPERHVATLAPGSWHALHASVRPSRRGWAHLGPLAVRTAGPSRLAGRQGKVDVRSAIKVYPALPTRKRVLQRLHRDRSLLSGEHRSTVLGGGTDFDSLREYHPDDEFRRINWAATARSRKPVTNHYREEKNQQIVLVLDASRMMATSIDEVTRFEYSIDAAVALAELATRMGDQVGMTVFGAGIKARVPVRSGRDQSRRIVDALFDIEPSLDAPDYRGAFGSVLIRNRRRSLLVLVTELTDEAAMESLLGALPALVTRHVVIVGALRDPALEVLVSLRPEGSADAYLKAAAGGALLARLRSAHLLRSMGAVVIDRAPSDLGAAIADEYLHAKQIGRL